jgi:C1A family cysteine protease
MRYGWKRDKPDSRDRLAKSILSRRKKLPSFVDLRELCSKVEDQSTLGSCTANALVGALELLDRKDGVYHEDFSRLFVYYNERVLEGTVNEDSGAMIRDGIKTLVNQGVCSETLWPYDISKFADKPTDECYEDALNHQITSYYRITAFDQMKVCLAEGFPFVFGFMVYSSFQTQEVDNTGIVPMPKLWQKPLGGHAVLCVGYDDSKQMFIVRNSWGENWGIKGYCLMPYKYLKSTRLSADFWTIRRGEGL